MDYAQILSQTKQLLGEVSEGSSTYADSDFVAAIQWAQEQTCQHLGLTYKEVTVHITQTTGPWGESINKVDVPTDAIKVTRAEIADIPTTPGYSISVVPSTQEILLDGSTYSVFTGTITRRGGFDEGIDIYCSEFAASSSGNDYNGTFVDSNGHNTTFFDIVGGNVLGVADTFTFGALATPAGWEDHHVAWSLLHLTGTSETSALVENSNEFSLTHTSGGAGYRLIVSPASSVVTWDLSGNQIDPPLVLTVTIDRDIGFTDPVDVSLPEMNGNHDGWLAVVNGVTIMDYGVTFIVANAPDTFTMEFTGTSQGWSLLNWVASDGGVYLWGNSGVTPVVISNLVTVN